MFDGHGVLVVLKLYCQTGWYDYESGDCNRVIMSKYLIKHPIQ